VIPLGGSAYEPIGWEANASGLESSHGYSVSFPYESVHSAGTVSGTLGDAGGSKVVASCTLVLGRLATEVSAAIRLIAKSRPIKMMTNITSTEAPPSLLISAAGATLRATLNR